MRVPRELRAAAKAAEQQGWTIEMGGSGHLKWKDPDGALRLVTGATPGGGNRAVQNAKATLKKWGVPL